MIPRKQLSIPDRPKDAVDDCLTCAYAAVTGSAYDESAGLFVGNTGHHQIHSYLPDKQDKLKCIFMAAKPTIFQTHYTKLCKSDTVMTLKEAVVEFDTGKYMLVVMWEGDGGLLAHALALVNGVIWDSGRGITPDDAIVLDVWKTTN